MQAIESHYRRAIDEGVTPAAVADAVVAAVEEPRFWVFPQPEFLAVAVERFERIAEGADPELAGVPGMPAPSELAAEVRAALGLD